ncbi:TRAP transporter large permease [Brevibacillus fulvus]|uniref:Tripartite ATP-independent transporter DctM subunit n=1 Tax=Brevibacillus fulvus TaxID=1125967 RepID=A0A938Y2T5_9BACL|nr:TRAP transporter large permease [Brevibacillus fulvus]MBM7591344.1 tripartite ATP-independent transporter DctM subunit [Brevibacillus fulvus]
MLLTLTLIILLFLLFIDIPISFALAGSSAFYILFNDSVPDAILIQRMVGGIESVPLLAIVFFIAAGILMNYTGITQRMLNFAQVITKPLPGRLAQVNVLISTMMGGISGSNVADAAMLSKILVPEMVKKGYPKSFSTVLTGATSLITPIIPPGIAMIMYGFVGNVSIGKLFMAGLLPGILLCVIYMIYVHFIAKKHKYEMDNRGWATPKEFFLSFKDALLAFILPIIIIGGIRFGIFSATEAGAIAVVFALVLGLFIYREMKFKHMLASVIETVKTSASILLIIAAGSAFGWILTIEQVPQTLTGFMLDYVSSPSMFFVIVLVFLLFIGMFVEGNVALIILTPLFMPMLQAYHIDPVQFGIFFIICLSIGTLTPPVGTIMIATCAITNTRIEDFVKDSLPFLVLLIIAALLIAFIPGITLWLPNMMF